MNGVNHFGYDAFQDVRAPWPLLQPGDQRGLDVGDGGADCAVVERAVIISLAAESGGFTGLGAGFPGADDAEEDVTGTRVAQGEFPPWRVRFVSWSR